MSPQFPQSMLETAGPAAEAIAGLGWVMMAGGLAIVLLVAALAFYGGWFARRDAAASRRVLLGGIGMTGVLLAGLVLYSASIGGALIREPAEPPLRIAVDGRQWWWEVRYPSRPGAVLANEVHIPVGRPVEVVLTSRDVIHSFWVPGLAGKIDMVPGRTTRLPLFAERAGVFRGQCAEFCGAQHARMAFHVVAEPERDFAAWLERQAAPAPEPADPFLTRGRDAFLAAGCPACHTVRGTPAAGELGPDLTHLGGRLSIGAGILPNNIGTIEGWIADSQQLKPGNLMPRFDRLRSSELRAIAAWLAGLE